jgi:hypothetical protein
VVQADHEVLRAAAVLRVEVIFAVADDVEAVFAA